MTSLSPREQEVLSLIASGLTLYQIARRLGIGYGTAKGYRSQVFEKLGAASSAHAVALAMIAGVELSILSIFAPPQKDG